MVPTLTPAFIIPEGIGGGISGGGQNVAATAAGVVAVGVIAGGLAVVAAPIVAALAAKAAVLTTAGGPGLLAIGAFLKALEQAREWGFINYRPQPIQREAVPGEFINFNTSVDVPITVSWENFTTYGSFSVNGGAPSSGTSVDGQQTMSLGTGIGAALGTTSSTTTFVWYGTENFGGAQVWRLATKKANGSVQNQAAATGDRTVGHPQFSGTATSGIRKVVFSVGGVQYLPIISQPGQFPDTEGVRPQLFPQTLPDAPVLPAPPLREPLQTPTLPPPPDRRPLAPPVTIPRPGQQPARVPVPGPRPGPAPGPGPSPTPTQPAPTGVPAIGPLPLPIPLPVPTTPGTVVIVDGQPIGGPGQAPAPNLVAIATELGRLERKNEILMSRPENGGAGPVLDNAILGTMRTALERLITELLNDVPPGSFTLSHVCPPPGGGDPLPPVVVPYEGGGNPTVGILAKMDGLAALIQAHKNMGQPTCKTAVSGEEVTIHFESDS